MDLGLQNRVAVVTGASAGIGRAVAARLAREGASLVISARGKDRLEEAADEIRSRGAEVEAVAADVATADGCRSVVESALHRFRRIDILVNNAGGSSGPPGFLALGDDDWQRAFDLNIMSAVRCSRAAIPHMQGLGGGRIINISSTAALQPDVVVCHYNVAKAGLVNLTKTLANGFAADGILVNCICPGLTRTLAIEDAARQRMAETGQATDNLSGQELVAAYWGPRRPIPVGRIGEPDDIAGIVAFLCSEHASWITGTCINVDGGWLKGI